MAEQADLSDLPTLMSHLLAGASRGGDPATSRLLEAAAAALQREVAEATRRTLQHELGKQVVVRVRPAAESFWVASDEHQRPR